MRAAGMYMEMLTPRTSVLGQTLSSAVFDFKVEQAASVRLVPTSVAPVPVLLPGEQTPRRRRGRRDGCLLQAAGGEVCPAVAHVANISQLGIS